MDYNNTTNDLKEKLLDENDNQDNEIEQSDINTDLKIKNWSNSVEELLKCWGEKCAGLSIMHSNDRKYWRKKSNYISLISIVITTVSSSVSLSSTSSPNYGVIMYAVGVLGLCSSLLQSLKQFYNADEKAGEHKMASRQFGNFYRSIKLQLALKNKDRAPVAEFVSWSFKEYEKLLQESPIINTTTIDNFKEQFKNLNCSKPDICASDITIYINRDK